MVATGYYIHRALGLTFCLILIVLSLLQLCYYLYLIKRNKKIELKCYIHFGCLFTGICLLICFSDGYGLLNLFPFGVNRILTNTIGVRGIIVSLCIIIYGHFAAHYLAAKKTLPPFFARALVISFILSTVPAFIGAILSEFNPGLFRIEVAFQTAWTASIVVIDAYGYYLVRELIIDLKKSQPPRSPTSATTTSQTNHHETTHHHHSSGSSAEDLLTRIRRYHILFLSMMIGYVIFGLYTLAIQTKVSFVRPNFDKFSMGVSTSFMPFTFLILQSLLTWWAWTPFTTMQEVYLSHSGDKMMSSTELHRKMTSSAPTTIPTTPSTKDKIEMQHISSTELIRSPSEEQTLLKTPTEQNIDNSIKEETVYYEQQSPVVGSEDLSASGRTVGVEDMSISGRPLSEGGDAIVHVTIAENGQIMLPQKL